MTNTPNRSTVSRSVASVLERSGMGAYDPCKVAGRSANLFMLWFVGASLVWITLSDDLVRRMGESIAIPEWVHTLKGSAYVIVFAIVLRRAARHYVQVTERGQEQHVHDHLEVVQRLARASEFHDDDTGQHNQRIGRTAAIVARHLGFSPEACETLNFAATLHDIGKIGISDGILLKPGPLTSEERIEMQRHAILGAELLDGAESPLLEMARTIALTHHERWDGNGYPLGLRGEDIPLESRIVAICDVFDALTHRRCYKEMWTPEAAMAEIRNGAGTQFDATVVEALAACLPNVLAETR